MRIHLLTTAAGPAGAFLAGEHPVGPEAGHVPAELAQALLDAGAAVAIAEPGDVIEPAPAAPATDPSPAPLEPPAPPSRRRK